MLPANLIYGSRTAPTRLADLEQRCESITKTTALMSQLHLSRGSLACPCCVFLYGWAGVAECLAFVDQRSGWRSRRRISAQVLMFAVGTERVVSCFFFLTLGHFEP